MAFALSGSFDGEGSLYSSIGAEVSTDVSGGVTLSVDDTVTLASEVAPASVSED